MVLRSDSIEGVERALAVSHNSAHYLRLLATIVLGALAALFLAWFMSYLIRSSDMSMNEAHRVQMLDFVRVKRDEVVERKDRKPQKPQLSKSPEVPPVPQSSLDAGQQLAVSAMPTDTGVDINQGGIGFGAGEGDYLPIVKVAPIYPQRALARAIFGHCLVKYTVTTAGTVKDVEVIEEECTSTLFYRSSIEAALRFKYKPRVIDGVPVEVRGVHNIFHYREEVQ
jgi:protein TonB